MVKKKSKACVGRVDRSNSQPQDQLRSQPNPSHSVFFYTNRGTCLAYIEDNLSSSIRIRGCFQSDRNEKLPNDLRHKLHNKVSSDKLMPVVECLNSQNKSMMCSRIPMFLLFPHK